MKVKILYFASLKDKVKKSYEYIDIKEGNSIKDLKKLLINKYPEIKDILDKSMIAVNESYVQEDIILNDYDTVAFIPPVGGG
ncbi:MAG: molybdopterin converting factor subunit 1 [Persephonella sp.]|nr:MAG: molybdopterin converting factor subunit 1 [Persephonella sp.]